MTKTNKDYERDVSQYVWGANEYYDLALNKLKDTLFQKGYIDKDSKWTLTKYSLLRLLFDHMDEVIKGFSFAPEQLVELIEYHTQMKEKFERLLQELAENKRQITEEILNNLNITSDQNDKK